MFNGNICISSNFDVFNLMAHFSYFNYIHLDECNISLLIAFWPTRTGADIPHPLNLQAPCLQMSATPTQKLYLFQNIWLHQQFIAIYATLKSLF